MNFQLTVNQFINLTLSKTEWTHEAHIITCIWHLQNYSVLETICLLRARIIAYNVSVGGQNTITSGYHETLTQFYIKILDRFLGEKVQPNMTFNEICDLILINEIAQRDFPLKYYSKELLFSINCRATWIEPDLKEI